MDIGEIIENLEAQNARVKEEIKSMENRAEILKTQIEVGEKWIEDLKVQISDREPLDAGKDLAQYG